MTTKRSKLVAGIFAIGSLSVFALVLIIFGGMRLVSHRTRYHVTFDESVMGLESGARVYFNGTKVGSVDSVAPDATNLERVNVTILVDESTPVRADSRAELGMGGLTGLKSIDLRGGTASAPRLAAEGRILVGETLIDKLTKQAKSLVSQSDELMKNANAVMKSTGTMMEQAKLVATNLGKTSESINAMVDENRAGLRASIASVGEATKSVGEVTKATTKILDTQVAQLLTSASNVVDDLGRMLHGNQDQIRASLGDIREASRSFKDLARDLRQKPSRLFFSGGGSERKLP